MAGRIFVTGDCHSDFGKFNMSSFPEQRALDKDDYMIICGDFGGIWDVGKESKSEKHWLDCSGALYRIEHLSWWKEELADEQEMEEGKENLGKAGFKVDYIITHCCSTGTQAQMGGEGLYDADRETDYLEFIKKHVEFDRWYFGHYHMDCMVNEREVLLYEQIIEAGLEGQYIG